MDKVKEQVYFVKSEDGEITAIFPNQKSGNGEYVGCYAHIGQHSECALVEWALLQKSATKEEYKPLFDELTNLVGYDLEIVYPVKYRGGYKNDEVEDEGNPDIGKVFWWTMKQILEEINRDRSNEWTDYDETDYAEGLDEWTWYEPLTRGKPLYNW